MSFGVISPRARPRTYRIQKIVSPHKLYFRVKTVKYGVVLIDQDIAKRAPMIAIKYSCTSVVTKYSYSEYIQNNYSEYILNMNMDFHIHDIQNMNIQNIYSEYILNI